jgi:hypothetical protein
LVYAAGQADAVCPLDRLAEEITRRVLQSRRSPPPVDLKSYVSLGGALEK